MIRQMRLVRLVRVVGRLRRRMAADADRFISLFFEGVVDRKPFLVVPLRPIEASLTARHRSLVHWLIDACNVLFRTKANCQLSPSDAQMLVHTAITRHEACLPIVPIRLKILSSVWKFVILAYTHCWFGSVDVCESTRDTRTSSVEKKLWENLK